MKKNQNGVTLIALAVTIIVMLILAGATMATLTGENGIITQSRRSAASNTEGTVKENMTTAFNSVMLEVSMDRAGNEAYDAQADENIQKYLDVIVDQIGKNDAVANKITATGNTYSYPTTGKTLAQVESATKGASKKYVTYVVKPTTNNTEKATYIYIDYYDTTFKLDLTNEATKANNKNEYPFLRMEIKFVTNSVSYEGPVTHAISGK